MVDDIRIEKFRPNLDTIARKNWGGDCSSSRTTRRGIRYFSCAAHGGYLVDPNAVTPEEKRLLEEQASKVNLNLLVQHRPDGDYVLGVDYQEVGMYYKPNRQRYSYNPDKGSVEWVKYPIYEGEEDEMWSVIEKVTGVRLLEDTNPEHEDTLERIYRRTTGRV